VVPFLSFEFDSKVELVEFPLPSIFVAFSLDCGGVRRRLALVLFESIEEAVELEGIEEAVELEGIEEATAFSSRVLTGFVATLVS
jgi:hypothetical protein